MMIDVSMIINDTLSSRMVFANTFPFDNFQGPARPFWVFDTDALMSQEAH